MVVCFICVRGFHHPQALVGELHKEGFHHGDADRLHGIGGGVDFLEEASQVRVVEQVLERVGVS